jgi:hypothetical protein
MQRPRPAPVHRSAPGARRRRGWAAAAGGVVLAAALAGPQAGCLSPPEAEELLAVGYRTPRQALETFQTYLRADLPAREYLCFSAGFRRRNGLSAATYGEGREQLFRQQPWLKLMARAEVVGERAVGEEQHWIDVRELGRTVRVKLVREGFYEIFGGEELLTDAYADFDALVRVAGAGPGARLEARIPLETRPGELAGMSEVTVARHWKIDAFYELGDQDEPLPSIGPQPQP